MMNSAELNIQNLTSLWRTVGEKHQSFTSLPAFDYSIVEGSEWPNRLWWTMEMTDESIEHAKTLIQTVPEKVTVPIWDFGNSNFSLVQDRVDFQLLFHQFGMSFRPKSRIKTSSLLELRKVSNTVEASCWSQTFHDSFGYLISPNTLMNTPDSMHYFLVYRENNPVGTVLTYETHGVLGIHSMGVAPLYRKQGIARDIMVQVINSAIDRSVELLTLQASVMGKNLYSQLGFKEQFRIKNYQLASINGRIK